MITFLPFPDFAKSAEVLDSNRLIKQIAEAKWMIDALESGDNTSRTFKHPACQMWIGHESALKAYFNACLGEALENRKFKIKAYDYYRWDIHEYHEFDIKSGLYDYPWWFKDERFHKAMRSRLIAKYSIHYLNHPLMKDYQGDKGYNGGQYWYPIIDEDGSHNFYRASDKMKRELNYVEPKDIKLGVVYRAINIWDGSSFRVERIEDPNYLQLVRKSTGELLNPAYVDAYYFDGYTQGYKIVQDTSEIWKKR